MLVVLIHGAYTSPWHWHRVVPLLEEAGCAVVVPELACDDPRAGIETYVATVEAALADADEPPLLVGSSLGALTACIVAARRPAHGLITVCGLIPNPGRAVAEDVGDASQPAFAAALQGNPDGTSTFPAPAAIELGFHDSDPELAREAAARLRRQAGLPLTEPCPIEAMPDVPRRGIVAPGERMLETAWLAGAVRERLGVEPVELAGDHTPMLSRPERLAEALLAPLEGAAA